MGAMTMAMTLMNSRISRRRSVSGFGSWGILG